MNATPHVVDDASADTSGNNATVEHAVDALARGGTVALWDEATDSTDLVVAAGRISASAINFLVTHGCGLVELALSAERVAALRLAPMRSGWDDGRKPCTVTIEAREGVGTGISAADRAHTIRVAVDPATRPGDLVSPGHIVPLRARAGGLSEHAGRTEAALALVRRAGCGEGAVLCTWLDEAGEVARGSALQRLVRGFGLPLVSIAAVARYERAHDRGQRAA